MTDSKSYHFHTEDEVREYFYSKGWTDGLPVVPPTPERVSRFLSHISRRPEEIVGTEPVKGKNITIEKIAINSVMAGCSPEYFPFVIGIVEAILEPEFNLHGITASTMGAAPLSIVSGPLAKKIGINGGISAFGPGHRANATIGRAIRLIIINATGSQSGEIDKATLGHAGKYTWVIAENNSLVSWTNLAKDRGNDKNADAVTVFAGLSPIQVSNHSSNNPKGILRSFRDALFAIGPNQGEVVIVLCPEHARHLASNKWGKGKIKDYLYQISQRTDKEWGQDVIAESNARLLPVQTLPASQTTHTTLSPDSFTIIVAGGLAGAFSVVIPLWVSGVGSQSVTKPIKTHR